jgi:hypothetical protein
MALCRARADPAHVPTVPAPSPGYVVYVIGYEYYGNFTTIYFSVDYGAKWSSLYTPGQAVGDHPLVVEADAQDIGMIYVGTGGRGFYYYDASADILEALLECEREYDATGRRLR